MSQSKLIFKLSKHQKEGLKFEFDKNQETKF